MLAGKIGEKEETKIDLSSNFLITLTNFVQGRKPNSIKIVCVNWWTNDRWMDELMNKRMEIRKNWGCRERERERH